MMEIDWQAKIALGAQPPAGPDTAVPLDSEKSPR